MKTTRTQKREVERLFATWLTLSPYASSEAELNIETHDDGSLCVSISIDCRREPETEFVLLEENFENTINFLTR